MAGKSTVEAIDPLWVRVMVGCRCGHGNTIDWEDAHPQAVVLCWSCQRVIRLDSLRRDKGGHDAASEQA